MGGSSLLWPLTICPPPIAPGGPVVLSLSLAHVSALYPCVCSLSLCDVYKHGDGGVWAKQTRFLPAEKGLGGTKGRVYVTDDDVARKGARH